MVEVGGTESYNSNHTGGPPLDNQPPSSGYPGASLLNIIDFFSFILYLDNCPVFAETYMQVRKQQLELDMEQLTGSK